MLSEQDVDRNISEGEAKIRKLDSKYSLGNDLRRFLTDLYPVDNSDKMLISRKMFPRVDDFDKINEYILETVKFLEECLLYNRKEYSETQIILGKLVEYKYGILRPDQGTPNGPFGERARPSGFGRKNKRRNK